MILCAGATLNVFDRPKGEAVEHKECGIAGGGDGCAEVGGMSGKIGTAAIGTELGNGGRITLLGSGKDCFARGGFLPGGGGFRRGGGGEGSTRVATSK